MADDESEKERREAEQSITAWFVTLERARQVNDFARAAQAKRELERLGVKVTYASKGAKAVRHAR